MGETVAIIQARMGSTRLPGKVLKDLCGRSVLWHVIARVKKSMAIDRIVVATTNLPEDDAIAVEAKKCEIDISRGSTHNVLGRYYHAAKKIGAETIVRITSDCPLYDPIIGDDVIRFYHDHVYDIVTNAGILNTEKRTFARGLDTEVFSFASLENAHKHATEGYHREHVTPYIYENFRSHNIESKERQDHFRLTIDTQEDYELIKAVYEAFYRGEHDFFIDDIIAFLKKRPDLVKLNAGIAQKEYRSINTAFAAEILQKTGTSNL